MEVVAEMRVPWILRGPRRSTTGKGTPWGRAASPTAAAAVVRETGRVSMRVAPFPFFGFGLVRRTEERWKRFYVQCFPRGFDFIE